MALPVVTMASQPTVAREAPPRRANNRTRGAQNQGYRTGGNRQPARRTQAPRNKSRGTTQKTVTRVVRNSNQQEQPGPMDVHVNTTGELTIPKLLGAATSSSSPGPAVTAQRNLSDNSASGTIPTHKALPPRKAKPPFPSQVATAQPTGDPATQPPSVSDESQLPTKQAMQAILASVVLQRPLHYGLTTSSKQASLDVRQSTPRHSSPKEQPADLVRPPCSDERSAPQPPLIIPETQSPGPDAHTLHSARDLDMGNHKALEHLPAAPSTEIGDPNPASDEPVFDSEGFLEKRAAGDTSPVSSRCSSPVCLPQFSNPNSSVVSIHIQDLPLEAVLPQQLPATPDRRPARRPGLRGPKKL